LSNEDGFAVVTFSTSFVGGTKLLAGFFGGVETFTVDICRKFDVKNKLELGCKRSTTAANERPERRDVIISKKREKKYFIVLSYFFQLKHLFLMANVVTRSNFIRTRH